MKRWSRTGMVAVSRWLVCVLVMLIYGALGASEARASNYSCDGQNHCYATVDWNGGTKGAIASISLADANMNHLVQTPNGLRDAFVTHELWLTDYHSSGCAAPAYGCWVEAGWKATAGHMEYFFSHQRPAPNNNYTRTTLGYVKEGEYYVDAQIVKWGNSQYVIDLHAQGPGTDTWYETYSTSNNMEAHQISTGTEVYGTHDGYSDWVRFSFNQWVDSDGVWHYQTTRGAPYNTGAPGAFLMGDWYAPPDQTPYNGGSWTTYFDGR